MIRLSGGKVQSSRRPPPPAEDEVPLFGTWRAAYVVVVACAFTTMILIFLFQGWSF